MDYINSPFNNSESLERVFQQIYEGQEHTVIVLPSLSFDREHIGKIKGVEHYETRSLWSILLGQNPQCNIIYLSSCPITQEAIQHLKSYMNPQCFEQRVRFYSLNTDPQDPTPLTQKILDRPKVQKDIMEMTQGQVAFIKTFIAGPLEFKLAKNLNIPVAAGNPHTLALQSKSAQKEIFLKESINHARGLENICSKAQAIEAMIQLKIESPEAQKMLLKLDFGVSGIGIGILSWHTKDRHFFKLTEQEQKRRASQVLEHIEFLSPEMQEKAFYSKIHEGAVLELFLEGEEKTSPSCQAYILPSGKVKILSTHEQILDSNGVKYLGSLFPAKSTYRKALVTMTKQIGQSLKSQGVCGPFSVDFLCIKNRAEFTPYAIEVNIREGGTTHPYFTSKLLTHSRYCTEEGVLKKNDRSFYYQSNDNFNHESFVGLDAGELLHFLKDRKLLFDYESQSGAVLHLVGALKNYGKFGYTCIGESRDHCQKLANSLQNTVREFARLKSLKTVSVA